MQQWANDKGIKLIYIPYFIMCALGYVHVLVLALSSALFGKVHPSMTNLRLSPSPKTLFHLKCFISPYLKNILS